MRILLAPDANDSASSSENADETSQTQQPEASSTPEKSLADIVNEAAAKSNVKLDEAEEDDESTSETESETPVEQPGEKPESPPEDASGEEEPPPFHEHPRWKEIQQQLAEARPLAEKQKEMLSRLQEHGGTEEQLAEAVDMVIRMQRDPREALEKLRPIVEQLEKATGGQLPDDLARKVEDGVIDLESAKEISRLRASQAIEARRWREIEQQRAQANVVRDLSDWETKKRVSDPDFDGKVRLIRDRMNAIASMTPPKSAADLVALAERAHKEVTQEVLRYVPKRPTPRTPPNGSSKKPKPAPTSLREVVQMGYEQSLKDD